MALAGVAGLVRVRPWACRRRRAGCACWCRTASRRRWSRCSRGVRRRPASPGTPSSAPRTGCVPRAAKGQPFDIAVMTEEAIDAHGGGQEAGPRDEDDGGEDAHRRRRAAERNRAGRSHRGRRAQGAARRLVGDLGQRRREPAVHREDGREARHHRADGGEDAHRAGLAARHRARRERPVRHRADADQRDRARGRA